MVVPVPMAVVVPMVVPVARAASMAVPMMVVACVSKKTYPWQTCQTD